MSKKVVTLYLEEDIVDELKKRRYNISYLCNETLRIYVDENFNEIEVAAKLAAIDALILNKKVDVERKYLEYKLVLDQHDAMLERRQRISDDYMSAQKTLRLSRMIRELNSVIISCNFDIPVIKESSKHMIDEISRISEFFDLETHVKRLQNVLS